MRKLLFALMMVLLAMPVFSQESESQTVVNQKKGRVPNEKKAAISVGVLQGGGGLVGVDFEYLIGQNFSAQAGIGAVSFGGALNYHFKPFINSSMVSFVYMHQGVGKSYVTSWVGTTYTYRAPKIFQASIGFGYMVDFGQAATAAMQQSPFGLIYSIGVYFPI